VLTVSVGEYQYACCTGGRRHYAVLLCRTHRYDRYGRIPRTVGDPKFEESRIATNITISYASPSRDTGAKADSARTSCEHRNVYCILEAS